MNKIISTQETEIGSVPGVLEIWNNDTREEKGKVIKTFSGRFHYFVERDGGIYPSDDRCLMGFPPDTTDDEVIKNFLNPPIIIKSFQLGDWNGNPIKRQLSSEELFKGIKQHLEANPSQFINPSTLWNHPKVLDIFKEFRSQALASITKDQLEQVAETAASWWLSGKFGSAGDLMIDALMTLHEATIPKSDADKETAKQRIKDLVLDHISENNKLTLSSNYDARHPLSECIEGLKVSVPNKSVMWIDPFSVSVRGGRGAEKQILYSAKVILS